MNLINRSFSLLMALVFLFSACKQKTAAVTEKSKKPLNIILLIGDGMGLAQISAASVINGGLTLETFSVIGLVKTSSSDDYITDSGAGATAYSIGEKTFNGAIGVAADSTSRMTILEMAEKHGLSTGLIATCSVTHATPASFYAHQKDREMHREIANDFYGKGVDFMAGTGKPYFDELVLKNKYHYNVVTGKGPYKFDAASQHVWFYNDSIHPPKVALRGPWLLDATNAGISYLSNNKKGFFLMVEGSQIDWGGHDNDVQYMATELIDFDKAVKAALEFAKKDGNTLVIVTADHETGGLALNGGSIAAKKIVGSFASTHHSGIMVPVYAFGPGAELFQGTMENTDIFTKMKSLYGF
jgi:alkaline phosphatase